MDYELKRTEQIHQILRLMKADEVERMLIWLISKYNLEEKISGMFDSEREYKPAEKMSNGEYLYHTEAPTTVEEIQKGADVHPSLSLADKERMLQRIEEIKAQEDAGLIVGFNRKERIDGLKDFHEPYSFLKVIQMNANEPNSTLSLLAAAYLHFEQGKDEFQSLHINQVLKQQGINVKNISMALNELMEKNPKLFIVTTTGAGKRKFYKLTEKGKSVAKFYQARRTGEGRWYF